MFSGHSDCPKPPENTSSRDGLSTVYQSESASRAALRLAPSPPARACGEFLADGRPLVDRAGIEIRPVRPYERSDLRIQDDASEESKVLKRAEERTMKHWPKVDVLSGPVTEAHRQLVRSNHFEAGDTDDWVWHYLSGSILTGG
jgi:hypothetical protein